MASENEVKTSAEPYLARVKDFAWLGAIVAAIWAAATYLNDKRLEYGKSFNENEIALSFQTAETVAKLLTAETKQDWDTEVAKFRNLYWGPLVLVESSSVEKAMVDLCAQMKASNFNQRDSLKAAVLGVSSALREQIRHRNENDWRIDLPSLTYTRELTVESSDKQGPGC